MSVESRQVAVLRAWFDRPEASLYDFDEVSREVALRVVFAVGAVVADDIYAANAERVESMRELGEPSAHAALFTVAAVAAENVARTSMGEPVQPTTFSALSQ